MPFVREIATKRRAQQARRGPHGGGVDLIFGPLERWNNVAHNGHGQGDQPAAAHRLQGAGQRQGDHGRRDRAEDRAHGEEANGPEQHDATTMDVAELAIEGRRRRGDQQIGGHDPGQMLHIAQLAADGGHGRADDGGVEGAGKHGDHQPRHDRGDLLAGQFGGGLRLDVVSHAILKSAFRPRRSARACS